MSLSPELSLTQRAAVERMDPEVCVVAGPGSGKTRVLIERFAWLVEHEQIVQLPLNGRTFIMLAALAPGVALPPGTQLPRINGGRPRTNEYLFDGISVLQPEPGQVVDYPIIDGMAEFKLNINAYSPEYGRSNGGTVMVIGKSGSNQFHGSLFEFFRNEALNARNLFAQPGPKTNVDLPPGAAAG